MTPSGKQSCIPERKRREASARSNRWHRSCRSVRIIEATPSMSTANYREFLEETLHQDQQHMVSWTISCLVFGTWSTFSWGHAIHFHHEDLGGRRFLSRYTQEETHMEPGMDQTGRRCSSTTRCGSQVLSASPETSVLELWGVLEHRCSRCTLP